MATTYKLTTLRDVYEQVPADKLALCMREIAESMEHAKALQELMSAASRGTAAADAVTAGADAVTIWEESCEWIDDGKEDKTIRVTFADAVERGVASRKGLKMTSTEEALKKQADDYFCAIQPASHRAEIEMMYAAFRSRLMYELGVREHVLAESHQLPLTLEQARDVVRGAFEVRPEMCGDDLVLIRAAEKAHGIRGAERQR